MNQQLFLNPFSMTVKVLVQPCLTLVTPWTVAHRLLCPWNSPGKNTGVGCHFLLQGIFPSQGLNRALPHCRQTLYPLSPSQHVPKQVHEPWTLRLKVWCSTDWAIQAKWKLLSPVWLFATPWTSSRGQIAKVSSFSLLHRLFPTQESNWGLLHCRHILYQLSYQRSRILLSVQLFSHVRLFLTPWAAAHQASLSIRNSRSLLKLMSIESVMPSNNLIPFL